jgi:serine/threonine protein kinase
MPAAGINTEAPEQQLRAACAELDRRLRAGERLRAERFLSVYPLLAAHDDLAVELIYTEFAAREELKQKPTPEEFYARFPEWKDRLRRQFQVHQLVRDSLGGDEAALDLPLSGVPLPPEPGPHARLGQYELLEEIARGGCGVVHKAWQHGLDRVVAVKVLLPEYARRRRARQRFCHEAKVMASLRHPHIMPVHEIGESLGVIFFSMDYLPAGSLAGRPAARGPGRDVLRLLETVARAIDHAHRQGVVHCDLKPSNVLLDAQGEPVVSDFGLARMPLGEADREGAGRIVGTPAYMAPEQVIGDGPLTPATDVWALGVMLYEALGGRRPFTAATLAELQQVITAEEPVPLEQLCPEAGEGLIAVCRRCLAKEAARRYTSAAEFADDLRRHA